MDQALLNDMLSNAVHFGHKTHKWNPKMKKYIHGKIKDIHVINLVKTARCLEEALNFLKKSKSEGKTILVVGTKDQTVNLVKDLAEKINMPYINSKWIGGFITNYRTMSRRIRHLKKLKDKKKTGEFEKYTKKEQSMFEKEIIKLEGNFGGVENIKKTPDVLLVTDVCKDKIAIKEANKLKIPVVGICDTNSDPDMIKYPIPANDDSIKSLNFLFDKIGKTLG